MSALVQKRRNTGASECPLSANRGLAWHFTKDVAPSRQTPPRLSPQPQASRVPWRFPKIRGDGFDHSALSCALSTLTRLAKRDDHRLGIGTGPALEGPLVVVNLLGRLDQREKHRRAALRAWSLGDRRRSQFEAVGPGHHAVLCLHSPSPAAV